MFGYITKPSGPPDMKVIGTNLGPSERPVHVLRVGPEVATYQTMYTTLDPASGKAQNMVYAGSWGILIPAGRPK